MRTLHLLGSPHRDSITQIGHLWPLMPHSITTDPVDPLVFYDQDPLVHRLRRSVIDGPFVSTKYLFGFGDSGSLFEPSEEFPLYKPFNFAYLREEDRRRYANSLSSFIQALEGEPELANLGPKRSRHENQVRHVSSRGIVYPSNIDRVYVVNDLHQDVYGNNNEFSVNLFSSWDSLSYTSPFYGVAPIQDSLYPLEAYGTFPYISYAKDVLDGFINPITPYVYDGVLHTNEIVLNYPTGGAEAIFNLSYGLDELGRPVNITYSLYRSDNTTFGFIFEIALIVAYEAIALVSYDPAIVDRVPRGIVRTSVNRSVSGKCYFFPSNPSLHGMTFSDSDYYTSLGVCMLTVPTPERYRFVSGLTSLARSPKGLPFSRSNRLLEFRDSVREDLKHLRASGFLAVQDAVDNHVNIIKTNHIETLSELRDILGLIPEVKLIPRFARALKSGDFITAGDTALDFLTSTNLKVKFGLSPSASALVEAYTKAPVVRERLSNLYGPRTLHGKFVYTLPEGTYGYRHSTLVARAAVRIHFDESSLLASTLGARAVGLFPSLSSIWDLVPMSFVVDWFTRMGDRLSAVDSQISYLCFRFSGIVYSYSIYTDLDDDLLALHMLESAGIPDKEPQLVFYQREVSVMRPQLLRSQYDFLSVTRSPDLGTVGSLVYQVIRH